MWKVLTLLAVAAAVSIGLAALTPEAVAKKGGGHHAGHAHHHHYHGKYRLGRWVNGVWIVNGVAASVAVSGNNCGYYYGKWKETGRSYWRDRYYESCR
jgi:hypothetical protein